jgi:hypothetical protein
VEGQLHRLAEQKDERLKQEETRKRPARRRSRRNWSGRARTPRAAGQGQGASGPLEELQSVEYQKRNETNEIFIPPGERLGNR